MKLEAPHYQEIAAAMADIRAVCQKNGIGKHSLGLVRDRMALLARRTDLFNSNTLPAPGRHEKATNFAYRLHEEDDLAFYANSANGRVFETPVHNHKTWAVLVGIEGIELNRLFVRTDDGGLQQVGQVALCQGSSLIFSDEDLHAIRIEAPLLNFHLYGKGLEQQRGRQFYDPIQKEWVYFQAHPDILDARAPCAMRNMLWK